MLTHVSPGFVLTTDNRIVRGGPMNVVVGPGMRLNTDGTVTDDSPKWDVDNWISWPQDVQKTDERMGV